MTSTQPQSEDTTAVVSASPPMAVLPLNSSSKLDQEPNPFEQSFFGANHGAATSPTSSTSVSTSSPPQKDTRPVLPPVASMTSPAVMGALPKDVASQFSWDTLRSGPLSPSMLAGPAKHAQYNYTGVNGNNQQQSSGNGLSSAAHPSLHHNHQQTEFTADYKRKNGDNEKELGQTHIKPGSVSSLDDSDSYDQQQQHTPKSAKKRSRSKAPEDDEKRRNFLERNRIAALKCRQRKKQWLNNLQMRADVLSTENEQLQVQVETMREEIMNLKTLLLAHKDCPVTQNSSFNGAAAVAAAAAAVPKPLSIMPQQVTRPSSVSTNQPIYPQSYTGPSQSHPVNTSAPMASAAPFHQSALLGMRITPQSHPAAHQGMMAGAGASTSILRF